MLGDGKDNYAVNIVESYLKRELRLLGDIDVVGEDDDWEYLLMLMCYLWNLLKGIRLGGLRLIYPSNIVCVNPTT